MLKNYLIYSQIMKAELVLLLLGLFALALEAAPAVEQADYETVKKEITSAVGREKIAVKDQEETALTSDESNEEDLVSSATFTRGYYYPQYYYYQKYYYPRYYYPKYHQYYYY